MLIIRHADAEPQAPLQKDEDRALTAAGRESFERLCLSLKHLNLSFGLLLESPFIRAGQTADIVCRHFEVKTRLASQNLKPGSGGVEALFQDIAGHNVPSAAVTGHQPFLGELASQALAGQSGLPVKIGRGSLAFLDFPGALEPGAARLEALLSPELISPD